MTHTFNHTIENNIPAPLLQTRRRYAPVLEDIAHLKVGESFVFETQLQPVALKSSFTKTLRKSGVEVNLVLSQVGEGKVRVWRVQ